MDNQEYQGLTPNEQAIMEKQLPGRGLLEQNPELALADKLPEMDGDHRTAEIIQNEQGKTAWRKDIAYNRVDGKNTDVIKAITERAFNYDDKGNVTTISGTNTDREHSWVENYQYDDQGTLIEKTGQVTEGERMGEIYREATTREKIGDYTKETTTIIGKKMIEGQLQDFTVTRFNFLDAQNQTVYGHQEETGKPESAMTWGEKPTDLED
ncbi:MAG: hypothetical protein HZC01_04645 [Candidatus Kerfeldbacteria bacterium]|nr:hypothetical protein [Candidatus Kerfeldbacteria bacterium]